MNGNKGKIRIVEEVLWQMEGKIKRGKKKFLRRLKEKMYERKEMNENIGKAI